MMLWHHANCYINVHMICSLYLIITIKYIQESGYEPSILLWESIFMTQLLKLWGFFFFLCIFLSSSSFLQLNGILTDDFQN